MIGSKSYIQESNRVIREDLEHIASDSLPWETLRGKTVMVTGGGGFLAAYLIKSLSAVSQRLDLGIHIICVARNIKSVEKRLADYLKSSHISIILHDISQQLPQDFPSADIYIHSASQASPKYYGTDPVGTLLTNSTGTMYLLDHAVKTKAERFLFFSSGEVYGVPIFPDKLVREHDYGYLDTMNVRSCYAESKRIGETMCVAWAQQHGLHTSVVRPFHTYGPGMDLNDGRVFADFVADVVENRDIVLRSDGLARRPFCYIADATVGFLTVLLSGGKAEAYNVGNPEAELSISDLATVISGLFPALGIEKRFEIPECSGNYLNSPISRSCPSIEKINALGWFPTTSVEDGFRRTIQSFL